MIDWNDEAVRETARFIVDASYDLLAAAQMFAPGHENEFLTAMADAMVCDQEGCECGGAEPDHWPLPFPDRCPYQRHCPCGGHYHKSRLVLDYGT